MYFATAVEKGSRAIEMADETCALVIFAKFSRRRPTSHRRYVNDCEQSDPAVRMLWVVQRQSITS